MSTSPEAPGDQGAYMESGDPPPSSVGQWRWALLRSDLSRSQWSVAMALSVRMDPDGAVPRGYAVGVRTIAADARVNKDTAAAALAELVALGWLVQVEAASGRRPGRWRASAPAALRPSSGDTTTRGGQAEDGVVSEQGGHNVAEVASGYGDVASGFVGVASQDSAPCVRTQGTPPAVPAEPAPPAGGTGDPRSEELAARLGLVLDDRPDKRSELDGRLGRLLADGWTIAEVAAHPAVAGHEPPRTSVVGALCHRLHRLNGIGAPTVAARRRQREAEARRSCRCAGAGVVLDGVGDAHPCPDCTSAARSVAS